MSVSYTRNAAFTSTRVSPPTIVPEQIGFDDTVDFLDIELFLFADGPGIIGEVRNLSATLLMRIPDFITVERII